MELQFSRIEKIVGVFVIGVTILMLTTLVWIGRGQDWFESYIPFYTTFNESYNLQENAAVKLFKADIGKVKRIDLEENKVRVQVAILEKYRTRIRTDSVAVVESPTLIGSEYISILPGSSGAELIPDNGEIPSKAKRSLADILAEFEVEKTAKMVIEAVQALSDLAGDLKDPDGPLIGALENINQTTTNIKVITEDVRRGEGSVGEILRSRAITDAINANLEKTAQILAHLENTTSKAPRVMDRVEENLITLQQAEEGVVAGVGGVQEILEEIHAAVEVIHQILDNIKTGSEDVPQITQSTKEGIREIRRGVENIDAVIKSLQKNVLIRSNLPPPPITQDTDAGLRE
jgi:phospholipid/cholesterol/gamma-HCH transport system substrate-binding protein